MGISVSWQSSEGNTIASDSRYSSGLFSKVCKKTPTCTSIGNECVCPHAVLIAVALHII